MNTKQLMKIMKFHLENFNDENVKISDATIHNEVLSDSDGYGNASSKNIYKSVIRWSLKKNGNEDVEWPSDWMNLSVEELANKLIPG